MNTKRRFLAILSTVFLTTLLCLTLFYHHRQTQQVELRIKAQFEELLPEAAEECGNNIFIALKTLDEKIRTGIASMNEPVGKLAVQLGTSNLHNVEKQARFEKEVNEMVDSFLRPSVMEFFLEYNSEVKRLESRLLVKTEYFTVFHQLSTNCLKQTHQDASLKRQSGSEDVADDFARWMIFVGDAYDIFSTFVYDINGKLTEAQAQAIPVKIHAHLQANILDVLANDIPRKDKIIAECKTKFDAKVALQMLEEERQ